MKKPILIVAGIIVFVLAVQVIVSMVKPEPIRTRLIRDSVAATSSYADARIQSDKLLVDPKSFGDYEAWDSAMTDVETRWAQVDELAAALEETAVEASETALFDVGSLLPVAQAYDSKEVSAVFDAAPAGKRLKTLAEHLGVDARRALQILKVAQSGMEADAWNQAGDTFETLENSARAIKDGSKVALFVGGAALSGGATTLLSEASMVVGGVDLVLEVGQDYSAIAYGYNSKAVAVFSDLRSMTEPAAGLLSFAQLPSGAVSSDAWDKVGAALFTGDQLRSLLQEDKVIGLSSNTNYASYTIVNLDETEVGGWLKQEGIPPEPVPPAQIVAKFVPTAVPVKAADKPKQAQKPESKPEPKPEAPKAEAPVGGGSVVGTWRMDVWNGQKRTDENYMTISSELVTFPSDRSGVKLPSASSYGTYNLRKDGDVWQFVEPLLYGATSYLRMDGGRLIQTIQSGDSSYEVEYVRVK